MSDETDTMSEVARVLIEHTRIDGIHGDCLCKHVVPLGHSFAAHQAAMLAEAGLLRDYATIDALNERCRILVDEGDRLRAQIATQEPAGEPVAPPEGVGTSGTLSGRLRAAADYQDRPGAYDELRAMAGEVDVLVGKRARQAQTIGELQEVRERLTRQVTRVQALAQWFHDQGQTGYARKVEEAVEG